MYQSFLRINHAVNIVIMSSYYMVTHLGCHKIKITFLRSNYVGNTLIMSS